MKKNLLLSLSIILMSGQITFGQVLGTPIVNWDFGSGIPANWQNGSASGIGMWEYRGPATTPNNSIGARGSCAAIAQPIASQTQSNGFVIFDSNYWDDIDMECGGLGTGVDPAPHEAWLITNPINLSTTIGSVLTFQHQYRNYIATMKVQISTNGGVLWTDILTVAGFESSAAEWQSVNISALASGQSNVQFKFIFSGTYYWWLLDDITVYEPNENDVALSSVKYTNNTGANNTDLEYDQYPLVMIPAFNMKATCANIGATQQTNVRLNARIIRDGATQTFTQTTAGITMNPGQSNTFAITPAYTNPATLGDYEIFYDILQNQVDNNLINNKDSLDYTISTYNYARDEGPMENSFEPTGSYIGYNYEAGNFFQARNTGRVCHSIGVAIAEGTDVGAQIKGIIYADDMETVLAETGIYTVNIANINAIGEERIIHLPLLTPLTLTNNVQYLVMMSTVDAAQTVKLARSGQSIEESSILRYPDVNALFFFLSTPVVRMKIFAATDVPGCTDVSASNYNAAATINDGSCIYVGCSNPDADNYNPIVNFDDGSCVIGGCLDPTAANYDSSVNYDDGSCIYPGCTDETANNYDPEANEEDGSCLYVLAQLEIPIVAGCAPLTITANNLTDISENGTCVIDLGNTIIIEECVSSFEATYTIPGIYTITYTYSQDGFESIYTQEIEVYELPETPLITYNSGDYTVNCSNCNQPSIEWFADDVIISSDQISISILDGSIPQNGDYYVMVQDELGCESSSDVLTVIQPLVSVNFTDGCIPLNVEILELTDAVPGMTSSIAWGDGDVQNDFIGFASHTYESDGTFELVVTSSTESGEGTTTHVIQVYPEIIPVLQNNMEDGMIECTNCELFESVSWLINGQTFTGNGPFVASEGVYVVTGTTAEECSGESQIIVSSVDGFDLTSIEIYPNPAGDILNIISQNSPITSIRILDSAGRIVVYSSTQASTFKSLDTSNLESGIYFVELETTTGKIAKRIAVNH